MSYQKTQEPFSLPKAVFGFLLLTLGVILYEQAKADYKDPTCDQLKQNGYCKDKNMSCEECEKWAKSAASFANGAGW